MRIRKPDRLWRQAPSRRGLMVAAVVLALGAAGTGAAMASVAGPSAPAAPADTTAGTLTALPYTFPAGSGGSLVRPLGISAFQGHVYVSNTSDNVLSDLNGGNTITIAGSLEASGENGDGGPAAAASLWQPT